MAKGSIELSCSQFFPLLWTSATDAEDETDLILSDFFFSQVLRGEQDAIVPENHLDFLSDRPDNDTWNAIRAKTLLQYGQFSDALVLAKKQDADSFAAIQTVSAFFSGDQEAMQEGCTAWTDCPKGWIHQLPFETPESTNDVHQIDWQSFSEKDQPIFVEWALTNGHWSDTWTDIALQHADDGDWRCANIALATQTQDIELLSKSIDQFWGEDGSEWWFSYGKLVEEVPCHPNRFSDAGNCTSELQSKLHLLEATAHTGRLSISDAQNAIKKVPLDAPETTDDERILAYHLRVLTRELAGSTKGMEKYIALGLPYNKKPIFSIHMGRSKLYQQAKTTAIQNFSLP